MRKQPDRFFRKALSAVHTQEPRVINTSIKNAVYPKAMMNSKRNKSCCWWNYDRTNNNIAEQDHRAIKRLVKPGMDAVIQHGKANNKGYKIMNMMGKAGEIKMRKKSRHWTGKIHSWNLKVVA